MAPSMMAASIESSRASDGVRMESSWDCSQWSVAMRRVTLAAERSSTVSSYWWKPAAVPSVGLNA